MTLGASSSPQVTAGQMLSSEVDRHARCLELEKLAPVGSWEFGQGLRRASDDAFFLDLRQEGFCPFGVNHPCVLASLIESNDDLSPRTFPAELSQAFPGLAHWTWCVLGVEHPWLDKPWSSMGPWLHENATLKDDLGWAGLSRAQSLLGWSVSLGGGLWFVAAPGMMPASADTPTVRAARAWISLLFTPEVLGPSGRVSSLRSLLRSRFPWGAWQGLNHRFVPRGNDVMSTVRALASQGLAVSVEGAEVIACYGLSLWPADLSLIEGALAPHKV